MSKKLKSEGKCIFCNKTFPKTSINRHLQKHLAEAAKQNKPGKSFLVKIDSGYTPHFLSLWVDGETTIGSVDSFLRQIWLECCGHMSAFTMPQKKEMRGNIWDYFEAENLLHSGKIKEYEKLMEGAKGEIPVSRKTKAALYKGLTLKYEYDFGSTTQLTVTVIEEYPVKAGSRIVLLSRNEPLEIFCQTCKTRPATQLCIAHGWKEDYLFCTPCSKKHAKSCNDFSDYAAMPVINSPRMGVCAYQGGVIDIERDGVFVKE